MKFSPSIISHFQRSQSFHDLYLGRWPRLSHYAPSVRHIFLLVTADERLHHALTRARIVNFIEEELPALVALAELRRRQGGVKTAREFLNDIWESAERGPYPSFHADAFNVLSQIERDEGSTEAAIEAATKRIASLGVMGRRSLITRDWRKRGRI
jgi:hypothetical protein